MADDIDIEEHDVLDHPRIKNIFADITSIKTEIDYDEEPIEFDNYETEDYGTYAVQEDFQETPSLYQNRIILGTKPCTSSEPSSESDEEEPMILESSVVLEDWGVLLMNNPCYCCDCQILFPTENALDSHKMIAHSFLIAVGRNKAVKSTAKSSISARLLFEPNSDESENLCNHCNQIFPDEIALLKHSYEMLPRKFSCDYCDLQFDSEAVCKYHKMTHINAIVLQCPYCSCHFKYTNKLMTHMSHQHKFQPTNIPDRVKTNYQCSFCPAKMRDNKSYNGHIYNKHSELYNKVIESENTEIEKFKCLPCNLTFPSAYSERIHRVARHTNKPTDVPSKRALEFERPIKIEPLFPRESAPQKLDFTGRMIPRSTLFQCKKCQIHFVSSMIAFEHSKRCVLKRGEWKCKKCRRSFKLIDRHIHNHQHELTERLKVIVVREQNLNKILCKCKICDVCFDERTLLKYHAKGCTETVSIACNLCNNRIHEQAMTKHKRIHSELGPEQFVLVEYVGFHGNQVRVEETIPTVKQYNREKFYYYCPTCRCFMKVNKTPDKHHIGKCRRQILKRLCKLCGLTFSTKGFLSHKKDHKKFPHLKLRDLTFKSTQSGRIINPPCPDFKMCSKCRVKFFSKLALRNHSCNEEAKTCGYCNEKFSDLAYKLHIPFHEYNMTCKKENILEAIPELIKKYESLQTIWNILYLCETCDTILDSYDEVVEHGQDHFCNMESYNVTINHCNICDLKLVGKSYERHTNLHITNKVDRNSFAILSYKYDTLLSDTWYDMFKTLTKEQIDHILNKSKYKNTRNMRMDLLRDGPINLTLYQCDTCRSIVNDNEVTDHAKQGNCVVSIKFTCAECGLNFTSKSSHEDFHKTPTKSPNKNVRIITFNSAKDSYVNDALRSKMDPEALKFIRCPSCGKLINKAKYKKHVLHHKYYEKTKKSLKSSKNQTKFLVRPKFKTVEKSVHNFYKCRKCGVCVFKNNVFKHFCSLKNQKKQCSRCNLWFRSSHFWKHMIYHEKFKLTKKNVNVIAFSNGKVEKENPVKASKVVLYQCSNCSVCLHREMNIKRHICISKNYQKVCKLCDKPFYCARMKLHEKLHNDKEFNEKNIIIKKFRGKTFIDNTITPMTTTTKITKTPIDNSSKKPTNEMTDREFMRFIHLRFFQCTCKLLFVTSAGFLEHKNSCATDNFGVKCDTCGLVFHKSSIELHKKNKCPMKNLMLYIVRLDGDTAFEYDDKTCLYRCYKCAINYISFRSVFRHIDGDHIFKMKLSNCEECGIIMSTRSYPLHRLMHHQQRNLSVARLNNFVVTNKRLNKVLNDPPDSKSVNIDIFTAFNELDPVAVKRKIDIEDSVSKHRKVNVSDVQTPEYILYPCRVCGLNFLHIRTLHLHLTGNHDEQRFTCVECGLDFTKISLTRHLKTHHRVFDYKTFKAVDAPEQIRSDPKPIQAEEIQTPTEPTPVNTEQSNPTSTKQKKLYKCSSCDVYFLFSDACLEHVTDHTSLDPTEFIACKMCDLQFLCEYLGSHMKSHREKIFNIDEITVEEYQCEGGDIKIETYSAVDRLKSKLVTTTTHFDTEDDSKIDSTVTLNKNKTTPGDNSFGEANELEITAISETKQAADERRFYFD